MLLIRDTKNEQTLKTTIPYLTHIAIHCVAVRDDGKSLNETPSC